MQPRLHALKQKTDDFDDAGLYHAIEERVHRVCDWGLAAMPDMKTAEAGTELDAIDGRTPFRVVGHEHAVRPDHHREEVIETERGYDVESVVGFQANANSVNNGGVPLKRVVRASQWRIRSTKTTFEPKMHPSLVPHIAEAHKREGEIKVARYQPKPGTREQSNPF